MKYYVALEWDHDYGMNILGVFDNFKSASEVKWCDTVSTWVGDELIEKVERRDGLWLDAT